MKNPQPSLCDSCIHAYFVGGGSVLIGTDMYVQRYCPKPLSPDRPHVGRAIHASGYQECEFYERSSKRGRAPPRKHTRKEMLEIMSRVEATSVSTVARELGISKQRMYQLLHRERSRPTQE